MVLVYSDNKNLTLELLNKGSELAKELNKKLTAVIIGKDDFSKEYITHGADKVFVAETDLENFKAEEYTDILENIIKETGVETVLIGSNKNGKASCFMIHCFPVPVCISDMCSAFGSCCFSHLLPELFLYQ